MMRRGWIALGGLVAFAAAGVAVTTMPESPSKPTPARQADADVTLTPFADDAELKATLRRYSERMRQRSVELPMAAADAAADAPAEPSPSPAPMAPSAKEDESITNVQTAGVDEGGIVKRRGDHLVVLRRGRLFTVKIGDDSLRPVSTIDAFGPGIDPGGAWYDEMLVADDTIVVVGYSYQRGGTELVLFDLSGDGRIAYRATYHLRSNDYYSSRNYASRLIGDKLIFYSPLFLSFGSDDLDDMLPGLRPWRKDLPQDAKFTRILPADRVYRAPRELDIDAGVALHTVTICDLAERALECRATAVLGAPGQTFYVASDAAYVWTNPWSWEADGSARVSDVFRIPLDGSAPRAMQARGAPIDQLSFLERDGHLNVLVGAEAQGQWMWAAERGPGALALLRVPLTMFGDGSAAAEALHYRLLGSGAEFASGANNRFVGEWLLVGASPAWGDRDKPGSAYAIRYAGDAGFQRLQPGHGIERIEAMGRDAILVGGRGADLHFTSLRLGERAAIADVYVQANAAQGESRSHGFFYRAIGEDEGYVGLPVLGRDVRGEETASVMFLRNRALALTRAGALAARGVARPDDGCLASCVDWYGNARPIFVGDRVFALMGYELVEGRYENERVVERRRVDFTPATAAPVAD
ncbi:MAG: beta-propeller domain-containing protein [Pseudomonadota bacterium]